jgi:hypothetical protein
MRYTRMIDKLQAKELFNIVNSLLNMIQYTCFIIGFLCAIPRRSSIQLS